MSNPHYEVAAILPLPGKQACDDAIAIFGAPAETPGAGWGEHGFAVARDTDASISIAGTEADIEMVAEYVLYLASRLGVAGSWIFTWATRYPDDKWAGPGGGYCMLDLGQQTTVAIETTSYLASRLHRREQDRAAESRHEPASLQGTLYAACWEFTETMRRADKLARAASEPDMGEHHWRQVRTDALLALEPVARAAPPRPDAGADPVAPAGQAPSGDDQESPYETLHQPGPPEGAADMPEEGHYYRLAGGRWLGPFDSAADAHSQAREEIRDAAEAAQDDAATAEHRLRHAEQATAEATLALAAAVARRDAASLAALRTERMAMPDAG